MRIKKELLKKVEKKLFCIMIVMLALYMINAWLLSQESDCSGPEITFEQELLEVSISATEEELMNGVTAVDKRDGDVSDTIIIESMSKLLSDNQRIVTYVAFDKDGYAGKAERRIRYTDYTSPRFSMVEPLKMDMSSSDFTATLAPLRATDCIDGDISDQIIVVNTELSDMSLESLSGTYEVQVTNSCGDVASLKLPIKMKLSGERTSIGYAQIELTEYLVYTGIGQEIYPENYVKAVFVGGNEYSADDLQVVSEVDVNTPGVYTFTYTIERNENKASVDLIVVVEE